MDALKFTGKIVNGIGRHAELVIPGRHDLPAPPPDWPERLFPGSLNLRVLHCPEDFAARGLRLLVETLDTAGFEPELTIPQNLMRNNKLTPTDAMPHRGTAQVWRASLEAGGGETPCWVLRRFGSNVGNQLEMAAAGGLRVALGLPREKEWPAAVTMFGRWRNR